MFGLEILAGLFALLVGLHYFFTRHFNYWKNRNVKGPKPTVFFGNLKDSTLRKEPLSLAFKRIYDDYPKEPFVGIYTMTTPSVLIRDLDLIKHVMIKDFDMFEDRGVEFSKEGLGANLFHADGETWRVLRNRFTPLFTTGKLKNMLYLITERGDKFLDYVEAITTKQPEQSVHKLIQLYTVTTISACAFGLDIDTTDRSDAILATLDKIDQMIFHRYFLQEFDMMFPGVLKVLNWSLFPKFLTNFFEELVTKVVTERNGMPTKRNDFMDLILQLKNEGDVTGPKKNENSKDLSLEITNDVIAAQAFVFYAAGYETSATTMTFMLYELAKHPHIQDKLCQEIDEVLAKSDNLVTYDTLTQLPYMDKVFDETLRMYPLVDPLQRKVTQHDYTIPNTDVIIKEGQTVYVSAMGIHHDETLYPKPEEFDPERFDPKVAAARHSCAYLPFGVGPRNCIGMRFAKVQSRVCILKLLSRFRVELAPSEKELTFDSSRVIISPAQNFKLKFVPRKKVQ
ncbi:cytochrome P450 6B5-like [Aricia agestis]|uniref:cytochrome P450 6B5-like n=1 Tax=Aricia agestis TaxID=91739 RepID=UPI001C208437|nr:cytochrome P450 6B5-like [Aricia agestis]